MVARRFPLNDSDFSALVLHAFKGLSDTNSVVVSLEDELNDEKSQFKVALVTRLMLF